MNISLRLLALSLLSVGALHAQSPSPARATEADVSVQFSLFAWQGDVASLRFASKRTVEAVASFERSMALPYTGPATLDFFPAASKEAGPNGPPPSPAATATFPLGASKVTLITAPVGKGRYKMYAVSEDGENLPADSIRLHNFTSSPLLIAYNENETVELPPTRSVIIKPSGTAVVIRVARMENGKWRRLFNNVAELNEDRRQNVILTPNEHGAVRMITLPPWPGETNAPKVASNGH